MSQKMARRGLLTSSLCVCMCKAAVIKGYSNAGTWESAREARESPGFQE